MTTPALQPMHLSLSIYLARLGWVPHQDAPEAMTALHPPTDPTLTVLVPNSYALPGYSLRMNQAIIQVSAQENRMPQDIAHDLVLAGHHRLRADYQPKTGPFPGPTVFAHTSALTALKDILKAVGDRNRQTGNPTRQSLPQVLPNGQNPHSAELAFPHSSAESGPSIADSLAKALSELQEYVKHPTPTAGPPGRLHQLIAHLVACANGEETTITVVKKVDFSNRDPARLP